MKSFFIFVFDGSRMHANILRDRRQGWQPVNQVGRLTLAPLPSKKEISKAMDAVPTTSIKKK